MDAHSYQSVANLPRGVKSISDQPSSAMVLLCVHSVTSRLSSPQKNSPHSVIICPSPGLLRVLCYMLFETHSTCQEKQYS